MRRAEVERRRALAIGGVIAVGVLGIVAIAVALAFGRGSAQADVASTTAAPPAQVVAETSVIDAEAAAAAAAKAEAEAAVERAKLEAAEQAAASESVVEKPAATAPAAKPAAPKPATQRISIAIGDAGYEPTIVQAKAGAPIELTVAQGEGCAAGFIIPDLGVQLDNSVAPATAKLGVVQPGEYRFFCAMEMVEGRLIVR